MANTINALQVLALINQLPDAERQALATILTGASGSTPAQVSAPIAQTAPQSEPVQQTESSRSDGLKDTVVYTCVNQDGKGVEFYVLKRNGKRGSAQRYMSGVKALIEDEIKLEWDKSLPSTDTYQIDYVDEQGIMHPYGSPKTGAHWLVGKDGKHLGKAKVAEWVKAHEKFVLTAEGKAEHFAAKAEKQAKKLERDRKILAKYGYTM